jgi:hypothetical protein
LSEIERLCLLREAGDRLQRVTRPSIHPDRLNSQYFYEIKIKEDMLQRARRNRIEKQRWFELREQERLGLRKRRPKAAIRKLPTGAKSSALAKLPALVKLPEAVAI